MYTKTNIIRCFQFVSILAFLTYILFGIYITINQNRYIYLPPEDSFLDCPELSSHTNRFGSTRMYYKENSSDTVVVFYHGNNTDACELASFAKIFDAAELSFVLPEYTGYGQDGNVPSRFSILQNVRDTVAFVEKKYKTVIVIGRSLGTGMASYHAGVGRVDNLLLISPFSAFQDAARNQYWYYPTSLMLRDDYDNSANLRNYVNPVSILIAEEDEIVPVESSYKLYNSLITPYKEIYELPDGHYELYDEHRPEFENFLAQYIESSI